MIIVCIDKRHTLINNQCKYDSIIQNSQTLIFTDLCPELQQLKENQQFDCQTSKTDCQSSCESCSTIGCQNCINGFKNVNNFCYSICSDKITTFYEQCDDGNIKFEDGCHQCQFNCPIGCSICIYGVCYHCFKEYFLYNHQSYFIADTHLFSETTTLKISNLDITQIFQGNTNKSGFVRLKILEKPNEYKNVGQFIESINLAVTQLTIEIEFKCFQNKTVKSQFSQFQYLQGYKQENLLFSHECHQKNYQTLQYLVKLSKNYEENLIFVKQINKQENFNKIFLNKFYLKLIIMDISETNCTISTLVSNVKQVLLRISLEDISI